MIIREREYDRLRHKFIRTNWTVKKIYPHVVLCENKFGFRTCFSMNDLMLKGIVRQSLQMQALIDEVNNRYNYLKKIPHAEDNKV